MNIQLSPDMELVIQKLRHCQDSKTHTQVFFGSICIELQDDTVIIRVDDPTWETESKDRFDTNALRI